MEMPFWARIRVVNGGAVDIAGARRCAGDGTVALLVMRMYLKICGGGSLGVYDVVSLSLSLSFPRLLLAS